MQGLRISISVNALTWYDCRGWCCGCTWVFFEYCHAMTGHELWSLSRIMGWLRMGSEDSHESYDDYARLSRLMRRLGMSFKDFQRSCDDWAWLSQVMWLLCLSYEICHSSCDECHWLYNDWAWVSKTVTGHEETWDEFWSLSNVMQWLGITYMCHGWFCMGFEDSPGSPKSLHDPRQSSKLLPIHFIIHDSAMPSHRTNHDKLHELMPSHCMTCDSHIQLLHDRRLSLNLMPIGYAYPIIAWHF